MGACRKQKLPLLWGQQQRGIANFRRAMRRLQWPLMRAEMCAFFEQQLRGPAKNLEQLQQQREGQQQQQPVSFWRSSSVDVECRPWERFISSQQLQAEGFVPAIISGKGVYRRCAIPAAVLHGLAFDEAEGHLSLCKQACIGSPTPPRLTSYTGRAPPSTSETVRRTVEAVCCMQQADTEKWVVEHGARV